ncbi:MAG: AI-2E family transporter [Saprospiraceae bacterium]|nr:AI-2E family transporter [Saprospiraceae bacterium]
MKPIIEFPGYIKFAYLAIGASALLATLYLGQYIIVPFVYALIVAILLVPLVELMSKRGLPRSLAISVVVILTILLALAIVYLIFAQGSLIYDSIPVLMEKNQQPGLNILNWISTEFKVKPEVIQEWMQKSKDHIFVYLGSAVGSFMQVMSDILFTMVLLPVYLFMVLYYKDFFIEFIKRLFHKESHVRVFEVLHSSKKIIQWYLIGLLLEAAIVAILNIMGLWALGIEHAIILGLTGALLNIIPYIGGMFATLLTVVVALTTKEGYNYAMAVVLLYVIIQLIDNNFIVPKIVGSRVRLNALVSVVVVILGAAMWGISGMFLSIPITAILKVILDHVDGLKPWGYLLGNDVQDSK